MTQLYVGAGDTVRIVARDVTHLDTGSVTAGLTGTVTIYPKDGGAAVVGPTAITLHNGDDWYVDIAVPSQPGAYRADVVLTVSGATRVLHAMLIAQ